jgi:uncharacterized protein (UPF0335 family)
MKKAYAIQLSYNISDNEKLAAEKALLYFSDASKKLEMANNHLNILKVPFEENQDITKEALMEERVAIRRFRDKAIDNFNLFKISAFKCVDIMQNFSSDTESVKMLKSFISEIDNLEEIVNDFADLFKNINSNEFKPLILKNIKLIQDKCQEIQDLTDQRIKAHLQTNILARSWVNSVSNQLQKTVEKKKPLILDLYNKMQDELNIEKK